MMFSNSIQVISIGRPRKSLRKLQKDYVKYV